MYTPLYFGTMYIYSKTFFLTMLPIFYCNSWYINSNQKIFQQPYSSRSDYNIICVQCYWRYFYMDTTRSASWNWGEVNGRECFGRINGCYGNQCINTGICTFYCGGWTTCETSLPCLWLFLTCYRYGGALKYGVIRSRLLRCLWSSSWLRQVGVCSLVQKLADYTFQHSI